MNSQELTANQELMARLVQEFHAAALPTLVKIMQAGLEVKVTREAVPEGELRNPAWYEFKITDGVNDYKILQSIPIFEEPPHVDPAG